MDSNQMYSSADYICEIKEERRRRIVADLFKGKWGDRAIKLLGACRSWRLILWTLLLSISGIILVPMNENLFSPWFKVLSLVSSLSLIIPMNTLFTLTLDLKVLSLILRQFGTWAFFGYVLIACAVFYDIHGRPENNGVLGYWWFLLGGNSIYFISLMIFIDAQKVFSALDKGILLFTVFTYCGLEYFMLRHEMTYDNLDAKVIAFRVLDLTLAVCLHIGTYCLGCLWRLVMKPDKLCGVLVSPNANNY